MAKNEIGNIKKEGSFKEKSRRKKGNAIGKAAHTILDGTFLTKERFMRLMPFILYLMFLAMVHVANSYRAEKSWFQIERIRKDLDELRYRYITTKSQLMYLGKQSEMLRRLEPVGLKELTSPPVKLNSPDHVNDHPSSQ